MVTFGNLTDRRKLGDEQGRKDNEQWRMVKGRQHHGASRATWNRLWRPSHWRDPCGCCRWREQDVCYFDWLPADHAGSLFQWIAATARERKRLRGTDCDLVHVLSAADCR